MATDLILFLNDTFGGLDYGSSGLDITVFFYPMLSYALVCLVTFLPVAIIVRLIRRFR